MDSTAFSLPLEDQEKILMIESLTFRIGSSSTTRPSDLVKSDLSAEDTAIKTTIEASIGSFSEANFPVSTESMKSTTVAELDEIIRNLDLEELSGTSSSIRIGGISKTDLIISNGDVSKNTTSSEQAESYQSWSQGASGLHQVYMIISDTSEEFDNENNPVINLRNLERGANHRPGGEATPREKVHLSREEWQMIKAVVHRDAIIPADSRREVLMGYQYALHQQKKQLLWEKSEIRRMHESTIEASRILREEHSTASYTGGGQQCKVSKGAID
jgi:hypothetical protein